MSVLNDALSNRIRETVRDVPDFPKPGIIFKDLTPVWADGALLADMTTAFVEHYADKNIDAFVGIESRGFIVATPVATALKKGVVLLRKPGKLPAETVSKTYDLEYGTDSLELHADAVKPGMRVVVLDDLLATGGTMGAAIELLKEQGAEVVEAGFIVDLTFLEGRKKLGGVAVSTLIEY